MFFLRVLHRGAFWLCLAAASAEAQQPAEIAARVKGQPIFASEVDRLVRESLQDREVAAETRVALRQQALEQLVARRLILDRLHRDGRHASADEIARAVQSLRARSEGDKQRFENWLTANGFTEQTLQAEVAWRISWRRYLDMQIADDLLEAHFQKHRRHYDGSQVRAAHILWKRNESLDFQNDAVHSARQVQQQLVAGRLTFAEAAKKYSEAPSRMEGGDLGFIPRYGVMDEAFARTAFNLEKGQTSEPVVTRFGVHLIHCLDIRPGEKTWGECREALRRAVAQELFDRLATEERRAANVKLP